MESKVWELAETRFEARLAFSVRHIKDLLHSIVQVEQVEVLQRVVQKMLPWQITQHDGLVVVLGPGRDCSQCFLIKAPVRLWALHVVLIPQNLFVHIWLTLRLVSNDQSLLPKLLLKLDFHLE